MSYLNRNRLKNFFVNLKKYFKSEDFLNSMAISNAEIDNIANTAGYNDNGTGTVNYDFVPRSGGAVMTGGSLSRTVDNDEFRFDGGTGWNKGSSVVLCGKDNTNTSGVIRLHSSNSTSECDTFLKPDGTFTFYKNGTTKNVAMQEDTIPRSGGAVLTGTRYARNVNGSYLSLSGGTDWQIGGSIALYGPDAEFSSGCVQFVPAYDGNSYKNMKLYPNGTWTWDGTAVQLTSDQRYKQQIDQIDDKLLDAWEDVEPCQFKYNDAVDQKGDKARLHTGYVVQQIAEACQNHDVDISEYGLYCHEVYPEKTEEVTITNEDGTTKKETKVIEEASEHYSLRYTEALIVECAFLRREVERLTERVTKLESRKKKTTS